MDVAVTTAAEKKAMRAEELPAFSGLKLVHIKRQLEILLGLIGTDGIFDEYTRHDISHIDNMLGSLDWLMPEATKEVMSPADWLITVLGVYFHDLGMLVTPEEFQRRDESEFPQFKNQVLFDGDGGQDYRTRIDELPEDDVERFLYRDCC